jgi:hypothetical protein
MHHSDDLLVGDSWGTRHLTTPSSRFHPQALPQEWANLTSTKYCQ